MKTFSFTLVVLLLIACNSSFKKNNSVHDNLNGNFKITQLYSNTNLPAQVTINFDTINNKVSGNAGCNQFFGIYSLNKQALSLSKIATSNKLCIDDAINKTESEVINALELITSYEYKDNQLLLKNNQDKTIFKAVSFNPATENQHSSSTFKITYDVSDMNGQEQIIMTPEKMTCNKISPQASEFSFKLTPTEAKEAETVLAKFPLNQLESIESPSNDRHLDGAAYAKLIIEYQGNTYNSKDFDHGNPPTALLDIVQLLLGNTPCP